MGYRQEAEHDAALMDYKIDATGTYLKTSLNVDLDISEAGTYLKVTPMIGTFVNVETNTITQGTLNLIDLVSLIGTLSRVADASISSGTLNSLESAVISSGTIDRITNASISSGTLNRLVSASIADGTISRAVSLGTLDRLVSASISDGTINRAVSLGTVDRVVNASVSSGTIDRLTSASVSDGTLGRVTSLGTLDSVTSAVVSSGTLGLLISMGTLDRLINASVSSGTIDRIASASLADGTISQILNASAFSFDSVTNAQQTIDVPHYETHEGNNFYNADVVDLSGNGTKILHLTTINSTKLAHLTFEVDYEKESKVIFYRNVTVGTTGTQLAVHNRNQDLDTVGTTTLFNDPTDLSNGTIVWRGQKGDGNKSGGLSRPESEIMLKRNNNYILEIVNMSSSNSLTNWVLNWYEE